MSGFSSYYSDAAIASARRRREAREQEQTWRAHYASAAHHAHVRWKARQRAELKRIHRALKRQMSAKNQSQFDEAIALDPVAHKARLDRLYDRYMQVYEDGLASEDEKTRIKCADILRGMHIGGIGVGEPATDARNSEIAILGFLPDLESGPTVGELADAEDEVYEEEQLIGRDDVEERRPGYEDSIEIDGDPYEGVE